MRSSFNTIPVPQAVVRRAAAEAAFAAMLAFRSASEELAQPRTRRRPAPAIHAGVLAAERVAARLAQEVDRD